MSLAIYAKVSLALLFMGSMILFIFSSKTVVSCILLLWFFWSICTLKLTAKAIDACSGINVLFPWYVVIIPVLLFDLWWATAVTRMTGEVVREINEMEFPVTATSNYETLSSSPVEVIIVLSIATIAIKLALPKLIAYDKRKEG